MAQQPPTITCEDVLLDEARRMSRGPRMNLELYMALKQNIPSLDNTAPRLLLPDGTNPTTMKNRILRVAAELGIAMTIRRVPGGLLCWRSSDADLQQAQETASRLQTARRPPQGRPTGRRLRGTRSRAR
jgi:hypothetical protein